MVSEQGLNMHARVCLNVLVYWMSCFLYALCMINGSWVDSYVYGSFLDLEKIVLLYLRVRKSCKFFLIFQFFLFCNRHQQKKINK